MKSEEIPTRITFKLRATHPQFELLPTKRLATLIGATYHYSRDTIVSSEWNSNEQLSPTTIWHKEIGAIRRSGDQRGTGGSSVPKLPINNAL